MMCDVACMSENWEDVLRQLKLIAAELEWVAGAVSRLRKPVDADVRWAILRAEAEVGHAIHETAALVRGSDAV